MRFNAGNYFFLLILFCFTAISLYCPAQEFDSFLDDSEYYTVKGYRHGVSTFKKVHYEETVPIEEGVLDFKHYHTYDEIVYFLKKWAAEYPDLIDFYSAGKTYEGRDIPQVTLTNKKTGRDTDKPGILIDACTHSQEMITTEATFWMLAYLLENYGKDEEITKLIDTKALYFRPINNPDGNLMVLNVAMVNRSTVRPYDDDRDGLLDEDPGEDLNGDNNVTLMRKNVGKGNGNWTNDPRDPSGRLLKRVSQGDGEYVIYLEGIDNDEDGRYNEDAIGGLDLHRNYPGNWRPMRETTGRGRTQGGAGEYPLSEPEIQCFVLFLLSHPNISIVNSMHSQAGAITHGPSTSESKESMFSEDEQLYRHFDREGKKITGYHFAGDMAEYRISRDTLLLHSHDRQLSPEVMATVPRNFSPSFGQGPDFGYFFYGSIWYSDELYQTYGAEKDYDNNGIYDPYDGLRTNDDLYGGEQFKRWEKYDHPQLGEVEIGGFSIKFSKQNPPPEYMEYWAEKEARFNIYLAKNLPQIEITSINTKPSKEKGVYDITVNFTNTGFLPTALEQAKIVKIVREDRVRLNIDRDLTQSGKVEIITNNQDVGWTKNGETKTALLKVKLNGISEVNATVDVLSTRGGRIRKEIVIGVQ
ncbi:M14 family metallopeptidase [Candidatus Latescibacterota bacterium]